jgi:hypothetical protein
VLKRAVRNMDTTDIATMDVNVIAPFNVQLRRNPQARAPAAAQRAAELRRLRRHLPPALVRYRRLHQLKP